MISIASRTSSVLCAAVSLLVAFDLVACQGSRVLSADETEKLEKEILEHTNKKLSDSIVANLLQLILGTIVVVIMMIAIYKCLKRNEEFYRTQGEAFLVLNHSTDPELTFSFVFHRRNGSNIPDAERDACAEPAQPEPEQLLLCRGQQPATAVLTAGRTVRQEVLVRAGLLMISSIMSFGASLRNRTANVTQNFDDSRPIKRLKPVLFPLEIESIWWTHSSSSALTGCRNFRIAHAESSVNIHAKAPSPNL